MPKFIYFKITKTYVWLALDNGQGFKAPLELAEYQLNKLIGQELKATKSLEGFVKAYKLTKKTTIVFPTF